MADEKTFEIAPETEDVELEPEEEPKPKGLAYDDDAENLVPIFMKNDDGKQALKEIAKKVIEDFEADQKASEEYVQRQKDDYKIFLSELPQKDTPFAGCANANVPIMVENITRNSTRAELELFGDWSEVIGFVPVAPEDETHRVLGEHTHWQFRNQIKDFIRQQSRGMLLYFLHGDVTCRSYYDPELRTNRHEYVTSEEFVVPFSRTSTMTDWSDVPHYTLVLQRYRHELQAMRDIWYGVEEVIEKKPAWDDEPNLPISEGAADTMGIERPDESSSEPTSAPYKLLQYEGWLELPNQDRDRWCQAIVDQRTETVLSLIIYEMVNWQEQDRFDRQSQELQTFQAAQAQYEQDVADFPMKVQQWKQDVANFTPPMPLGGPGMMPSPMGPGMGPGMMGGGMGPGMMGPGMGPEMGGMPPMAPPEPPPEPMRPAPPAWMDPANPTVAPPKRDPVRLFTHFVMIEPLAGNRGTGFGRQQADFNRAANVSFDQFIDQASIANGAPLITASGTTFKGGWKLGIGVVNEIENAPNNDIRQAVLPMTLPAANPQLMEAVQFLYGVSQSSMQSPNVLSGEPGKSGETFRGISLRSENALKQLTVPTRKFAMGFCNIVKANCLLNSMFLPDEEIINITDRVLGPKQIAVGRQMYARNYDVEVRSDLRFASNAQRVAEADEIIGMANTLPWLLGNGAFAYKATAKRLEACGARDMIPLLGAPPPPPPVMGMPMGGMMPPGAPGAPTAPGAAPPGGGAPPKPEAKPQAPPNAPQPGGQPNAPNAPPPQV